MRRNILVSLISFITCLLLFSVIVQASSDENENVVSLFDNTKRIQLEEHISIFADINNAYTIDDIRSSSFEGTFELNQESIPNYGYTDTVYWVKVHLRNQSSKDIWLLEIDNATLDYLSLYFPETAYENAYVSETGDLLPFDNREVNHRNFVYRLQLEENNITTLYLRFESEGAMQLPITLWHQDAFIEKSQLEYALLGIFFGILSIMALYNLFLFFSLRHWSYLFYVLFIASNIFIHLSFTGTAYQYIWPEQSWWNNRAIVLFMLISNIFGYLFAKSFLEMRKVIPGLNSIFNYLIFCNFVIIFLLFYSYSLALNLVVISSGVTVLLMIWAGISCYRKGYQPAKYFLLAWHISFIGTIISLLADAGFLPIYFVTKYAWQITASIEFLLFSFALADKINMMKKEKEQAEQEVIKSNLRALENLKKTDKLKDEFLAMTSHELRTPLHGMIGIAETMYDGATGKMTQSMKKHLSMIISSGKRLSHLINDILDFSILKNDAMNLHLKKVHLKELVDVVIIMSQSLLNEKNIRIINEIDTNIRPVLGDENRLQQVFFNLIGNAIKYTERGTVVISAEEDGKMLQVHITDSGIGISADQIDTIFDAFNRGGNNSEEQSGTGLGLNITKKLIEAHGGNISVVSQEGKGSTFSFLIPLFQEVGFKEAKEEVSATLFSEQHSKYSHHIDDETLMIDNKGKNIKILIADDERVNLQLLSNHLSLQGYYVDTAKDGDEVLHKVESGNYHLLILDMMMPRKSGYEVCQQLRKRFSLLELPVLILTAKNQEYDKVTAFDSGANDYIVKPCEKRELLSRTKTLIELSLAVRKIKEQMRELDDVNQRLLQINDELEGKVRERTVALKEVNDELLKANEDLIKLQNARTHMLSNISHEFGTPVTFLQSYIQSVRAGIIEANDAHYLKSVENKVNMLNRLIEDLYDISKLESGDITLMTKERNLHEWINQMYDKFETDVTRRKITLHKPVFTGNEEQDIRIDIDNDRMDQVFTNIIYNAIKHTNEGGDIWINVVVKDRQEVMIEIKDNGHGIKESDLPFVFERFFKGEKVINGKIGTGLGLAISKEIIHHHNGEISVKSTEGNGAIFCISLPIVD
ncbi:ATP-binding protein [Evansella cellulosilytica]|uniref:histidine kinase n=1 Tax=Evansella cellulosilytica (strain ATCC 21833 / DSM 2522 / FERM P-1141 / JCM 9156 / N-4) TaxID=649639 RepID=E6U018_EVAC2|nr:ATP-binding protein [Evansella cellulosilytica]ADU29022.1 ATP-binding region ATPase domain protein [Evansella cellulosilytica DSM 2522]